MLHTEQEDSHPKQVTVQGRMWMCECVILTLQMVPASESIITEGYKHTLWHTKFNVLPVQIWENSDKGVQLPQLETGRVWTAHTV